MAIFSITLPDLKQRLSNILAQRTTRRYSEDERMAALEEAYLKICGKDNFSFLETRSSSIAITAGSNTFLMPDNFLRFDKRSQGLYLGSKSVQNKVNFLERADRPDVDESVTNRPEFWFKVGNIGYLGAKSDASYMAILEHFKKPDKLSEGTILIPGEYASIISWWAAMELMSTTNPKRPGVETECINKLNELIEAYVTKDADQNQDYIINNNWY